MSLNRQTLNHLINSYCWIFRLFPTFLLSWLHSNEKNIAKYLNTSMIIFLGWLLKYTHARVCSCIHTYVHIYSNTYIHIHMKEIALSNAYISTANAVIARVPCDTLAHLGGWEKNCFSGTVRATQKTAAWATVGRRRVGGRGHHFPSRRSNTCEGWKGWKYVGSKVAAA